MLVSKDYLGNRGSRFKCDRCKIDLTIETRHAIYIQEYKLMPKKAYDLCDRCYRALKRGIEKGV